MYDTSLWLGGKEYKSRLIVGTGKYPSFENMREAIEASGAEIVTVAVRRVSLPGQGESLLDYIDTKKYTLLPNTAGCYTADEALRTCYLAREAGLGSFVKLEVIGDSRTLFPDAEGLLEATRTLAREGFSVLPYTNDDPVLAKKLEDACPVDIFAARDGNVDVVEENLDECVLCELCIAAAPPGKVRGLKLYAGTALER